MDSVLDKYVVTVSTEIEVLANDSYEAIAIAQNKIDFSNLDFEANIEVEPWQKY